jgi:hypothetical protein
MVTVGAVRSIVTVGPSAWAFAFPAVSVTAADARRTNNVPSEQLDTVSEYEDGPPVGAAKLQPVAVPWLEKSPPARPDTDSLKVTVKAGLEALVMLSLLEVPVSEAACRLIAVTVGAVRSIVTVDPFVSAFWLPAVSLTAFAASRTTIVPAEQPDAVIVYDAPDPVSDPKLHPVAVPVFVKLPAESPDTDSLKVTLKTRLAALVMLSLFEVPLSEPA